MKNCRKEKRVEISTEMSLECTGEGVGVRKSTNTEDFSAGGARGLLTQAMNRTFWC